MVDSTYHYDLVEATPFICKSVEHLLSQQNSESIPERLYRELVRWRDRERGVEFSDGVTCGEVKVIGFPLLKDLQQHLKANQTIDGPSICQLLQGSRIVFPWQQAPPRNAELVARLEVIQRSIDNAEYNKMVYGDIKKEAVLQDFKLDVQATHRQMWTFFNFLFTVIGSFVFGYFAGHYAGFDTVLSVSVGLVMGLAVFFADLYFLMKHL